MDKAGSDANGCKNNTFIKFKDEKVVDQIDEEDDSPSSESKSLLPQRKGGISRGVDKTRRKVQWNDSNGNKLVEVLEYIPR